MRLAESEVESIYIYIHVFASYEHTLIYSICNVFTSIASLIPSDLQQSVNKTKPLRYAELFPWSV